MIPASDASQPDCPERIERIVEQVGRVSALEEVSRERLELRRSSRIGAVHSSTAIATDEEMLIESNDSVGPAGRGRRE